MIAQLREPTINFPLQMCWYYEDNIVNDSYYQSCDNAGKNDLFTNLNTFMIKYQD